MLSRPVRQRRKPLIFLCLELMKIGVVSIGVSVSIGISTGLVFHSGFASSFETTLPLQKSKSSVDRSRPSILRRLTTADPRKGATMETSLKLRNIWNNPSVRSRVRWCAWTSAAAERPKNRPSFLPPLRISPAPILLQRRWGEHSTDRSTPSALYSSRANRGDNDNDESTVDNDNDSDNKEEEIAFSWESFDRRGEWQTIDWSTTVGGPHPPVSASSSSSEANYRIAKIDQLCTKIPPGSPSPVELCLVRDRMVYVKRDDLLRLPNSGVSGNKARKMLALNELPIGDFPEVVVSYGGAQSNAMLALAAIVHARNEESRADTCHGDRDGSLVARESGGRGRGDDDDDICLAQEEAASLFEEPESSRTSFFREQANVKRDKRFVYYTKKLPRYLRKQPSGNLLRALSLGMEIVELTQDRYSELFGGDSGGTSTPPPGLEPVVPGKSVWIPQGGACGLAVKGVQLLAHEIVSFWAIQGRGSALSVCVPGGTCTTAMLLSREINAIVRGREDDLDIQVVVIPCVGGDAYALRQMTSLDISTGGNGKDDLPAVLVPLKGIDYGPARRRNAGYFSFGEPASAILDVFEEMKNEHGVYLDLLYGAPAWSLLLQHWKWPDAEEKQAAPIDGRQIMYVHSGGLEGISSQLTRYRHKGLIDDSQIQ